MWQPQEQEMSSLTYRQGHRVTGCRLEWGMAEIFGIFMLCKITPTCCFEHCVCQAPERRLSFFVCYHLSISIYYHLLALCVTWRKAWAHCHHIHGFLTKYHFTDWIVFQSHHLRFQGEAGEPWWGLARPGTSSHGHMWWLNLRTFCLCCAVLFVLNH